MFMNNNMNMLMNNNMNMLEEDHILIISLKYY